MHEEMNNPPVRGIVNHKFENAFKVINHMFRNEIICDITVVSGDIEIPAHKILLAANSPYLHEIFLNIQEREQNRIVIDEINPNALFPIIEYMYTSEIIINDENVEYILAAAGILQMDNVSQFCRDFLKDSQRLSVLQNRDQDDNMQPRER